MNTSKPKKWLYLIDAIIVLLNIAAGRGNIFPYWLFGFSKSTWVLATIFSIDVLYIILRFKRIVDFHYIPYLFPVYVFLITLGYNNINILINGHGDFPTGLEFWAVFVLFTSILTRLHLTINSSNLSRDEKIRYFLRGYNWISLFSVGGVILSFIAILLIGESYVPIEADFFESNIDLGLEYYRSYFSVITQGSLLRVPFFQEYGTLCGLFNEPHILAHNVFPFLILMIGISQRMTLKALFIVVSLVMILFAGSTMNILAVFVCIIVFFFVESRRKNIFAPIIGIVLLIFLIYIYISIDDTLLYVVLGRMDESNQSQQASKNILEFAFSPKSLLGRNFLDTSYSLTVTENGQDVGYIAFLLNIVFIVTYMRNVFLLLLKKDGIPITVGMASLYYIIHSAKIGMSIYVHSLPIYLVFLQSLLLSCYGRKRVVRKNIEN